MNVDHAALSDVGRRRTENQDSVLACERPGAYLFVVADGVGGLAEGAAASQTAVRRLTEAFDALPIGGGSAELIDAVRLANTDLYSGDGNSMGATGTTVVMLLLEPGQFELAHVGDSRAYLCRDGAIQLLTEDHTLVREQVVAGLMTPEQAAESAQRHVITRSLGIQPTVEVEVRPPAPLRDGDVFLLCSDGLHDVVTTEELESALRQRRPVAEIGGALIALANDRGGPDNISVVIAAVGGANA
jgi:protein phosphatase